MSIKNVQLLAQSAKIVASLTTGNLFVILDQDPNLRHGKQIKHIYQMQQSQRNTKISSIDKGELIKWKMMLQTATQTVKKTPAVF